MRSLGLGVALLLLLASCTAEASAPATEATTTRSPATKTQPPPTTTTAPPTTTTTTLDPAVIEARFLEQDLPIILKLWSDYADSWDGGADTAIRFIVDNNHPDLSLGVDDYTCLGLSYDSATYHSYHEAAAVDTAIVDLGSIVRSDGWTIPVGAKSRIDGETPRGRLYSMKVRFSLLDSDETTAFTSRVHVAILGEGNWLGAYFFIPSLCESNR